jgi:potassium/hydrogen antiporter
MDVQTLNDYLLIGAGVLILAILGVRLSAGVGLPSLLAYLGIGVVLGYTAISFNDAELAQALAFAALAIILTEGGLTTSWSSVRSAMPVAVILATLGVGISTATIGAAVHLLLGLDWTTALILGAVVSSTDAAAVFSVLRRVPLRPRVAGALEAESGLNDAAAVLLVTLLSSGALIDYGSAGLLGILTYQMVVGAAIGLAIGYVAGRMLRRIALPSSGLYPLAVVTTAILAYAVATEARASGFAAVYLGALLLGNSHLPHRAATRSFVEGLGWLAQIGLFVMLGLLVTPFELEVREVVVAVVVGLVALLLARPLSVLVCALPFRVPWREQAFLSAAGLRGAVPVVLATIPLSVGYPGSKRCSPSSSCWWWRSRWCRPRRCTGWPFAGVWRRPRPVVTWTLRRPRLHASMPTCWSCMSRPIPGSMAWRSPSSGCPLAHPSRSSSGTAPASYLAPPPPSDTVTTCSSWRRTKPAQRRRRDYEPSADEVAWPGGSVRRTMPSTTTAASCRCAGSHHRGFADSAAVAPARPQPADATLHRAMGKGATGSSAAPPFRAELRPTGRGCRLAADRMPHD